MVTFSAKGALIADYFPCRLHQRHVGCACGSSSYVRPADRLHALPGTPRRVSRGAQCARVAVVRMARMRAGLACGHRARDVRDGLVPAAGGVRRLP
jgi:hypothetical protein